MPPFPLNLVQELGHWESYIVYALIGFAFGFVLELSGFGNSKKLACWWYKARNAEKSNSKISG